MITESGGIILNYLLVDPDKRPEGWKDVWNEAATRHRKTTTVEQELEAIHRDYEYARLAESPFRLSSTPDEIAAVLDIHPFYLRFLDSQTLLDHPELITRAMVAAGFLTAGDAKLSLGWLLSWPHHMLDLARLTQHALWLPDACIHVYFERDLAMKMMQIAPLSYLWLAPKFQSDLEFAKLAAAQPWMTIRGFPRETHLMGNPVIHILLKDGHLLPFTNCDQAAEAMAVSTKNKRVLLPAHLDDDRVKRLLAEAKEKKKAKLR